jgi:hypothetical protein
MIEHMNLEQLSMLADALHDHEPIREDMKELRHHFEICSECRDRFGRLAKLVSIAETLPRRIEPPVDLWPSIRATIGDRTIPQYPSATEVSKARASRKGGILQRVDLRLAAAAGLLIATMLGGHYRQSGPIPTSDSVGVTFAPLESRGDLQQVSAIELPDAADLHAEEELLADLKLRRSSLRPTTYAEIDSSLKVIDSAIAELEAAYAQNPKNDAIKLLLAASHAQKLRLLKQTENAL